MKVKDIREMSTEEILAKVAELKEELFNLRFQLAVNNLDNTARIREVRRTVARCKTIIRERELQRERELKAKAERGEVKA